VLRYIVQHHVNLICSILNIVVPTVNNEQYEESEIGTELYLIDTLKAHLCLQTLIRSQERVSQIFQNVEQYILCISIALVIHSLCVSVACCCQSLAQQALMGTINSSVQAVQQAQADLRYVDNLPPLGHDLVSLPPTYDTG